MDNKTTNIDVSNVTTAATTKTEKKHQYFVTDFILTVFAILIIFSLLSAVWLFTEHNLIVRFVTLAIVGSFVAFGSFVAAVGLAKPAIMVVFNVLAILSSFITLGSIIALYAPIEQGSPVTFTMPVVHAILTIPVIHISFVAFLVLDILFLFSFCVVLLSIYELSLLTENYSIVASIALVISLILIACVIMIISSLPIVLSVLELFGLCSVGVIFMAYCIIFLVQDLS